MPDHTKVSRLSAGDYLFVDGGEHQNLLSRTMITSLSARMRILDCDTNARCTRLDESVALGIMRHRADRVGLHLVGRYLRSASLWSTSSAAGPGSKAA